MILNRLIIFNYTVVMYWFEYAKQVCLSVYQEHERSIRAALSLTERNSEKLLDFQDNYTPPLQVAML